MIKKAEERKFIVAYDFLNPPRSVILSDKITASPRDALTKIDVTPFVGRGMMICECKVLESPDQADDDCFEIHVGDEPMIFEITEFIRCLPIIEGELRPGLYRFYEQGPNYYEIKDAAALSKFFDEEPNFDYENEKFICRPDRISLHEMKTGEEFCSFTRYPFSFFDVHCPLCRQKVITYKAEPERFECKDLSIPCSHYVGHAVWCSIGYETRAIDDLQISHKLVADELYFDTAEGWQKPIIYAPPYQPLESIWDGSDAENTYQDHFFFTESEPRFRSE